jgi:alkylated DNA nucleotide flippase Atl1
VLAVVATIPPGRVMTYGDVAAVLGSRAARAVGNVMSWYGAEVPWWRVIRASGHPAAGHEDHALAHFRDEGTPLVTTPDGYRVNLRLARYDPA